MISLDDFRERMKLEIAKTKEMKSVQVSGKNLDDALMQASLELGLPIRVIEYEILDRGSFGFLGLKGRPFRIVAYESINKSVAKKAKSLAEELDLASYDKKGVEIPADVDGRFSVRLGSDGAWVKVFPPTGRGTSVAANEILEILKRRGVNEPDIDSITIAAQQADMMWVRAGEINYNPANDALMSLVVSGDQMKAYINTAEPGPGGADLTADDIKGFLLNNGIDSGLLEDALQEFEDFPIFGTPYLVAEGTAPIHGVDAKIYYDFETEPDKIHMQERKDGSIDFKELNKIRNVIKGQPLASKTKPQLGVGGWTVYGQNLPAKDGRDIEIEVGTNVVLSENGTKAIATKSGHVMLKNGKITVDTVLLIPGNVDTSTGNVNVLGSVEIGGNVEDGYSVTAEGRIEVAGYVGRANLNAGGDIIVSRGVNGGESEDFGHIVAGKSIWSSFIQNSRVEAGEFVIVSSGIVNSNVVSQKKILCRGRRAKIVGGHIKALNEVNAVILGSAGGAETRIEVGFDPKVRGELQELLEKRSEIESQYDSVELNLGGLRRQAEIHGKNLPKDKTRHLERLNLQYDKLHAELQDVDEEIHKKREYLETLQTNGRISAADKVLAGVVIRIHDVEYVVKESYEKSVTFILEGDYIRAVSFHDIEEDLTRR